MATTPRGPGSTGKPPGKTGGKDDSLTDVRKKIRDRIAMAEEAKRLDLQRRRLELAGRGVAAYDERHLADAAQSFKAYVKVLEDLKGVPSGGLSPAHFDKKDDVPEMMLISGVYWDLVKLYDRTRSAERYVEFKSYLAKFILFSKGMPFQPLASETMRKYVQANRPVHKKDMREAYKQIALSKCFIATELVEYTHVDTIPALRVFRDRLKKHKAGRRFVAWYYRNGPLWAEKIAEWHPFAKALTGRALDFAAALLG